MTTFVPWPAVRLTYGHFNNNPSTNQPPTISKYNDDASNPSRRVLAQCLARFNIPFPVGQAPQPQDQCPQALPRQLNGPIRLGLSAKVAHPLYDDRQGSGVDVFLPQKFEKLDAIVNTTAVGLAKDLCELGRRAEVSRMFHEMSPYFAESRIPLKKPVTPVTP